WPARSPRRRAQRTRRGPRCARATPTRSRGPAPTPGRSRTCPRRARATPPPPRGPPSAGAPSPRRTATRPPPPRPGPRPPPPAGPGRGGGGDGLRSLRAGNPPGRFPFTGGVFPFRRQEEDPARMFAGEGTPERTNRRFHLIARGQPAVRLSTAFDSVTLYGRDPDPRPDVWGKVGNSGVSVCTLDDAKKLYSGFDLCAPSTSVSMTIN